jgi:hypothetical protein
MRMVQFGSTAAATQIGSPSTGIRYMQTGADPASGATRLWFSQVGTNINGLNVYNSSFLPTNLSATALAPGFLQYQNATRYATYGFAFETTGRVWMANDATDKTFNVLSYEWNGGSAQWVQASVVTVSANTAMRSLAGRFEGGEYILYLTSRTQLWRYNTVTGDKAAIVTAPTNCIYYGVAFAPVDTSLPSATPLPTATSSITPSITRSSTSSPSQTASSSATASISFGATVTPTSSTTASPSSTASSTGTATVTSSNQVALFQRSDTVLVLRGGDGGLYAENVGVPLFVDELIADGSGGTGSSAVVNTVAVRTATSGNNLGCVASYYVTATPDESYPTLTADGSAMIFPCNSWAVNVTVPAAGGSAGRVVGVLGANGLVNTSTRAVNWMTSGNQRGFFRTVAAASLAAGIYVGGTQGGGGANDMRRATYGVATTATQIGTPSTGIRYTVITTDPATGDPKLAFSQVGTNIGLNYYNSSFLPVNLTAWALAPGFAQYQNASRFATYGFVFETPSRVWMTNDAVDKAFSGNLLRFDYSLVDGTWGLAQAVSVAGTTGFRSVTGRVEGGEYVLYLGSRGSVWRYNTVTGASALVATAAANTLFYGVTLAPTNNAILTPSALPTRTPTATQSATSSVTASTSATSTGSNTPSASITASSTASTTVGATASSTMTPSNTPSASLTASATGTSTVTPTTTPTVSPSNQVAAFQTSGTVLLLRGGDGAVYAENTAVSLFIDEHVSDGSGGSASLVSTIPIRNVASGNHSGCVASYYVTNTPDEAYPTLVADGSAMIFGCNAWTVNVTVPVTGGSAGRIVAAVFPSGFVATNTKINQWTTGGNQRGYFRTVASASLAAGIYVGGQQGGGGANDQRLATYGVAAAATYIGTPATLLKFTAVTTDPATGDPKLAFSQVTTNIGLNYYTSAGLPTATTTTALAPGFSNYQDATRYATYGFVFETPSRVWMTNNATNSAFNVLCFEYSLVDSAWSLTQSVTIAPNTGFRTVAGRVEGGEYILFLASRSQLWRYNTVTGAKALITTAPANTFYYGVTLPPVNTAILSATPLATRSSTGSTSFTPSSSVTASNTPTGSQTASPSQTASSTASVSTGITASTTNTASITPSATPSPSTTGTPTPTGTPTVTPSPSNQVALFRTTGTVLVLRGGDGNVYAENVAVPLFFDELVADGANPAAAVVATAAVRTATSGNNLGCVASYYVTATPDESYPSLTADGTAVTFPCNSWAVGVAVPAAGGSAGRVVGVLGANGLVNTSTRAFNWMTGGNNRGFFRLAVSASLAAGIYVGGTQGGGGANDMRLTTYGVSAAATYVGAPSTGIRYAVITTDPATGDPKLAFSQVGTNINGLNYYNSSFLPVNTTATALAPGFAQYQNASRFATYGFVFETPSRVWMTNDAIDKAFSGNLLRFDFSLVDGTWGLTQAVSVAGTTGFRSVTARVEGGEYVLYLGSRGSVWRYNTVTGASALVATAAANTLFYGVVLPPVNGAILSATPLPTRSNTPSASGTASRTPSASVTATVSRSPSAPATASATATAPATQSASSTVTRTPSRSNTASRSVSGTSSVSSTASVSASGSETASISATQTGTPSSSSTQTGTPSSSATPSSSQTGTPASTGTPSSSNTGTPASTGTPSGSAAPSKSRTPAPSFSATKSRLPTASRTRSRTATATKTKTKTRSEWCGGGWPAAAAGNSR